MDAVFFITGLCAVLFTLYAFYIMDTDMKARNFRPVYVLTIAAAAWLTCSFVIYVLPAGMFTTPEAFDFQVFALFMSVIEVVFAIMYIVQYGGSETIKAWFK